MYLLKVFWKRLTNCNSYDDPGWIKIPVDEVGAIHEFYIMSLSEQTSFRPIKITSLHVWYWMPNTMLSFHGIKF